MRNCVLILSLVLSAGYGAQTATPAASSGYAKSHFDGAWWLSANQGEQSGFVNGVADCMTWEAHKNGYSATPEQLTDKITKFYLADPGSQGLSVLEAWQRVSPSVKQATVSKGGEIWTNPHWYLNGDWWAQEAQTERTGFLEGYLWCLRTQVEVPLASYSKPASFYREKINAYVTANPKLGKEAVSRTLARFKDISK